MVSVSHETADQTDARLVGVIREAKLKIYDGAFAFREFSILEFPQAVEPEALAIVRDDETWSQLVPSDNESEEQFGLFRFHFPPNTDNSGFVGWLASRLKQEFGTGVFVTCGQNSGSGGIFDYWGVPISIAPAVLAAVQALCGDKNSA